MSWDEAWSLTQQLLRDPTSHVFAAVAGWKHPWSHEAKIAADTFDLTVGMNTKKRRKPKPYPRPWKQKDRAIKSAAPKAPQSAIREALAARGH